MSAKVILTSPRWHLSGVNTMNARLAHGLGELGHDVEILLTAATSGSAHEMAKESHLPLQRLPVPKDASWPVRWKALINYLESNAPCVYFPGYDFDGSSVSTALPASVAVIGVLHSDEAAYFETAHRLHGAWNGIVGVSSFLASEAKRLFPDRSSRIRHIPYGVDLPKTTPGKRSHDERLRVALVGRIHQPQKRVFDLPPLLRELKRLEAKAEVSVLGSGPDEEALRAACREYVDNGSVQFMGSLSNASVLEFLETQDALLMLSAYEGLPLVLLEAMSRGCIPVTTGIRSGIPDLVIPEKTGFRIPVGDTNGFARVLDTLQKDQALRARLSQNSFDHITNGQFDTERMCKQYSDLIDEVLDEARTGNSPGRTGKASPPNHLKLAGRMRSALSGGFHNFAGLITNRNP